MSTYFFLAAKLLGIRIVNICRTFRLSKATTFGIKLPGRSGHYALQAVVNSDGDGSALIMPLLHDLGPKTAPWHRSFVDSWEKALKMVGWLRGGSEFMWLENLPQGPRIDNLLCSMVMLSHPSHPYSAGRGLLRTAMDAFHGIWVFSSG